MEIITNVQFDEVVSKGVAAGDMYRLAEVLPDAL